MANVPVNDINPIHQYVATAGQTDFVFTYVIYETSDIKVYLNDVLKTETTDYTVKNSDGSSITADDLADGLAGGKVVFSTGLELNDNVTLFRDIPAERTTGFTTSGALTADALNLALNKIIALIQQVQRDGDRTIRQSPSDTGASPIELPPLDARKGKYMFFNNTTGVPEAGPGASVGDYAVSEFGQALIDDADAATALTTLGISAFAKTLLDDADAATALITLGALSATLLSAKGDLLYNNGTSVTRLPVGNQYDMLGVGASSVVGWEQNPQRRVVDLPNTDGAASDGGYRSGGVLLDDGTLRCWGHAPYGALGNGASPADASTNFLTPAFPIGTTGKPIKWERQGSDNIVLMDNGEVWVWGRNGSGQLGVGNTSTVLVPTKVTALNGVNIVDVQLSKQFYNNGRYHTLFLADDGSLYACGYNATGQLGIGNTTNQSTPQLLSKSDWVKIYAMGENVSYSAGIDTSGDLYTWGGNGHGQLGIGSTTNQSTPQLVNAFGGVTVSKFSGAMGWNSSINFEHGSSMCLLSTGAVYTWGHNGEGQLGTGNTTQYNTPQHISGLGTDNQDILMAHSAYGVSYVIKDDQSIVASGYNGYGQLGDGTTTNKNTHQTIPNSLRSGRTIAQLKTLGTLPYTSTVILYDDGYIQACGYNDNGNYGIGTDLATNTSLQPVLGFMKHKPVKLCSIGRGSEASLGVLTEEGVYYQCGAGVAFQFPHYREGYAPIFDTMQPLYFS
jgi:alpha-tubulin suppressor-like RCC1 family protein